MFEKEERPYPEKIEQILTFTTPKKQKLERVDAFLTRITVLPCKMP